MSHADIHHSALRSGLLDRIAMGLSGLCVVHCLSTAILLGLLASAGTFIDNPIFHEIGLSLAILMGALAIGLGAAQHGYLLPVAIGALGLGVMAGALTLDHGMQEGIFTIVGVGILALGHDLNVRAGR